MTCQELYAHMGTPVEFIGPILEEEGLEVFKYWYVEENKRDTHD
jgi:hypothetical protein